jgi:putative ABC transport system ATP-binding protein
MNEHRTGEAPEYLIRAERICRDYPDGDVKALRDVTLRVRRGEYLAIMGPSGSGKSTLLNLLGALDRPTSGEIFFDERPISDCRHLDNLRARQIGFVFQSFHLLPSLTALENVQIPMLEGPWASRERAPRARQLLDLVGLGDRARHLPAQLSVGQRQRVAIARALANEPPVLLADEPTGNLDSHAGAEVLDLFDRLHVERGLTLVVITHSQEVADRAEREIWIRDGQIVARDVAPGATTCSN